MKKFSTIAHFLIFLAGGMTTASQAASSVGTHCKFLTNAPDQHVVAAGDTLWGISGRFLQHAWCWPQVWGMNKEQIRNPHWIYPDQIVYFDRAANRLRLASPLGATAQGGIKNVHVSPRIRVEDVGKKPIPAIAANVIEPFLAYPLIVEEQDFKDTPRIVATQEGHVFLGKGDKAYVLGDLTGGTLNTLSTLFQAFRPSEPLMDPVTKKIIGYEAVYLGTLKLQRSAGTDGEAHTFIVEHSKEEMGVGDRLLRMPPASLLNYVPHPPEQPIDARIVSIYGGVVHAGQNQVVSINRGMQDGIDVGTVLALSRYGQTVVDRTVKPQDGFKALKAFNIFKLKQPALVKLPDEQYGTIFIFRVFNHMAYGLIMQVTDAVQVGDVAKSPE